MTKINNGGDAFPKGGYGGGMSLRDYFAAKALPLAYELFSKVPSNNELIKGFASDAVIAQWSYQMADAMIKARSGE